MAIPRFKLQNIGSLLLIEYVPSFAITNFSKSGPGAIASSGLTLATGYAWERIYCTQDTMGHQQDQDNSANGESWIQQVIGLTPGDEPAIEQALIDLADKRHVLRVTLPNGVIKIVGTPTEPLTHQLKSNTQTTYPGRSGTALLFSGPTTARALIYTP
jgi:hypothetical protein